MPYLYKLENTATGKLPSLQPRVTEKVQPSSFAAVPNPASCSTAAGPRLGTDSADKDRAAERWALDEEDDDDDLLKEIVLTKKVAQELVARVLDEFEEDAESTSFGAVRTVDSEGRVCFELAARGMSPSTEASGDPWKQAIRAVRGLRRDDHGVTGLRTPTWLNTADLDVQAIAEDGRAGLTHLAKRILQDLQQDASRLASKGYWMPFVDDGLCIASGADAVREVHQVDDLVTDRPAGVYLIVGCEKDSVATVYVGQSQDVFKRTLQHRMCYEDESVPAEEEKRLVYHLLKRCDQVLHFRLAHFAAEEKEARTMVEGLWTLLLGSYQWKAEWMALRRAFGLPNVGEQVRGGNSTHCFDRPRTRRTDEDHGRRHGFQSSRWEAYRNRSWHMKHMAARHLAAGRKRRADDLVALVKLSRATLRVHTGKLLARGELEYQPPSQGRCRVLGTELNVDFEQVLRVHGKRSWKLRLIEGDDNGALDTIRGAAKEDCPLFSGIRLQFRVEGSYAWITYHPKGSSRGKGPRGFALNLVSLLPAASRKRREDRAGRAIAEIIADRSSIAWEPLSDMARDFWDGRASMTRTGQLSAGDLSWRASNWRQVEERMEVIASLVGYDPGEGGHIPCRLRGMETGQCRIELLPADEAWVDLPFQPIFEEPQLKAVVDEVMAAWKAAHRGIVTPRAARRPDWIRPEFKYCRINHIEEEGRTSTRYEPRFSLQGKRPAQERTPTPFKRYKSEASLLAPTNIRYEGVVRPKDAATSATAEALTSSTPAPESKTGWGFKATEDEWDRMWKKQGQALVSKEEQAELKLFLEHRAPMAAPAPALPARASTSSAAVRAPRLGTCLCPGCDAQDSLQHGFIECREILERVWQAAMPVLFDLVDRKKGLPLGNAKHVVMNWHELGIPFEFGWRTLLWRNQVLLRISRLRKAALAQKGEVEWSSTSEAEAVRGGVLAAIETQWLRLTRAADAGGEAEVARRVAFEKRYVTGGRLFKKEGDKLVRM